MEDYKYDNKHLLRGLGTVSRMKALKQVTIYGKKKTLEVFPAATREALSVQGTTIKEVEIRHWRDLHIKRYCCIEVES